MLFTVVVTNVIVSWCSGVTAGPDARLDRMLTTPPDLVIFDNDGVLVDSERLASEVDRDCLAAIGVEVTIQDCIDHFLGHDIGVLRRYAEGLGAEVPASFERTYLDEVFTRMRAELRAVPGVADAIDAIEAAGIATCVASSGGHERIRTSLSICRLYDRFEGRIFSADDVGVGKPAPDLFLHAAATMGVPVERCAVIEDSPAGVTAAVAAGIAVAGFVAVTPAERLAHASTRFEDMAEVPALLGLG